MLEVSVMWGMKSWVVAEGKWEGIVVVIRCCRVELKGENSGGISQREAPGILEDAVIV